MQLTSLLNMWDSEQIKAHKRAAKLLCKIKDNVFEYIQTKRSITEYNLQQFIIKQYQRYGLITDKWPPIVAFNENTSVPEFYPKEKSKQLEPETFIMIDLWAKINKKNAPFADITWVAYYGEKIPKETITLFDVVIRARDKALQFIKLELKNGRIPTGRAVSDAVIRAIPIKYQGLMMHEVGHSLGIIQDHGAKPDWIYPKNNSRLRINSAYTIEPGLYLNNLRGVRSEIDFFITNTKKLVVTTDIQRKITKIHQ